MLEQKQCKVCGETKSLTEFYQQKRKSKTKGEYIYYNPECKSCTVKRSEKWAEDNPERFKELKRVYEAENIAKRRLDFRKSSQKRREKGKLLEWQRNNADKVETYNKQRRQHKKHRISEKEWEDCKNYFNYRCAYCGIKIEEHFVRFKGMIILGDFHKEHVDDDGVNDLSNCIPSCKGCNSKKHTFTLMEWFEISEYFNVEKLTKINAWLEKDHKEYITTKSKENHNNV